MPPKTIEFIQRWRIAIAMSAGSLTGGILESVINTGTGFATIVAAGVTFGLMVGLQKFRHN